MNKSETKLLAKKFLIERYANRLELNHVTDVSIHPYGFDATNCDLFSIAPMESRVGADDLIAVNRVSGEVTYQGIVGGSGERGFRKK